MIPNPQDHFNFALEPFSIRVLPSCLHEPLIYTTNTLIPIPQIELTKPTPQIIRKALLLTNNRTSIPTSTHSLHLRSDPTQRRARPTRHLSALRRRNHDLLQQLGAFDLIHFAELVHRRIEELLALALGRQLHERGCLAQLLEHFE